MGTYKIAGGSNGGWSDLEGFVSYLIGSLLDQLVSKAEASTGVASAEKVTGQGNLGACFIATLAGPVVAAMIVGAFFATKNLLAGGLYFAAVFAVILSLFY